MSAGIDHSPVRQETPTTHYEGAVRIPGFRDPPNRCRGLDPVGFCEARGHVLLGRSSCGTRYCPDHWREWCEGAVISMVARLAAFRESQEGWGKRMVHAVASPPTDRRYSARELWSSRSDSYDVLDEAGVRGGAVVAHPYRTTEEADRLYSEADVDDGTGKWRFLRDLAGDLPGDDWEQLAEYVEPSPHYHVLAAAEDVDGSAAPDSWVVENIRSFDRFRYDDLEAYRDMVATAYYVLTHGAEQQGRATTTYFGDVHPNAFDPSEELTTTKWRHIQRKAEIAVKGHAEEEEEGGAGAGPEECPRDGCESVVVDVVYLREYLTDDDWKEQVVSRARTLHAGHARLARLRGMLAHWECRTDRPPPSAHRSKERMREWLQERGEAFQVEAGQVGLTKAVMG